MAWQLTYKSPQPVPVEVEEIVPDRMADLSADQVCRLPVMVGNRKVELGELFDVSGRGDDLALEFHGELEGVHWIGAGMSNGDIRIHGMAGRHIGSGMKGGHIRVLGNAGDWVGAEMKGGLIHVHGSAGHLVGAAYRGSRRGMTAGTILIDGSVGNELGHTMRRGLIAVRESAGDLIGFNMLAGTVLVFGDVGIRHGAGMKRGTLGFFGSGPKPLLPTFRFACRSRPLAINLLLRQLAALGFEFEGRLLNDTFDIYNGDFIAGGRGEALLTA
ncbi:MAG: formylmethanofuran dehydrogenase subunit C [Planctomycetaceae bacterium]|nr:formylmethanofuran dehydrogenase subunit C [Planctomycetaceae bacterium]